MASTSPSSIEIAGLVLAAFPLLIAGIEHYRKGLEPFKNWANYEHGLVLLERTLESEKNKLENSCELFLDGLVSPAELPDLISRPGGPRWRTPELESKMRKRLGRSYNSFMDAIKEMRFAMDELSNTLEVGEKWKHRQNSNSRESWQSNLNRIKYSLTAEKRSKLQETLRSSNATIQDFTQSAVSLAPIRARRILEPIEFAQIRQAARDIYDVLYSDLSRCDCTRLHHASLRLEERPAEPTIDPPTSSQAVLPATFRVLFSFTPEVVTRPLASKDALHTDIVLEARDSSSNTTSGPQTISQTGSVPRNLCSILQQPYGVDHLAFRVTRDSNMGIYPARNQPSPTAPPDLVCLSDLLSHPSPITASTSSTTTVHLNGKTRRKLALTLASSVLQFHSTSTSTSWLGERWDKSDIWLLHEADTRHEMMVEQPYIWKTFASHRTPPLSGARAGAYSNGPMLRNKTIFDLGVLLIELWFNKSLEQLRHPEDLGDDGRPNEYTDFATALRLIRAVDADAGPRYGKAVRRCIKCDFDQREDDLDSQEFRQAVYQGVVAVLDEELTEFRGGNTTLIS